jgi:hypothetical protein
MPVPDYGQKPEFQRTKRCRIAGFSERLGPHFAPLDRYSRRRGPAQPKEDLLAHLLNKPYASGSAVRPGNGSTDGDTIPAELHRIAGTEHQCELEPGTASRQLDETGKMTFLTQFCLDSESHG